MKQIREALRIWQCWAVSILTGPEMRVRLSRCADHVETKLDPYLVDLRCGHLLLIVA